MHITKATRNRVTKIGFNRFVSTLTEPAFYLDRDADEIAMTRFNNRDNRYIRKIGWQINVAGSEFSGGWNNYNLLLEVDGTTPTTFHTVDYQRQTSLLGVVYEGGTSSSARLRRKKIAAGTSFDQKLGVDQTSFPGPDGYDLQSDPGMDRVFVSTLVGDPRVGLSFGIIMPKRNIDRFGRTARYYFNGPTTVTGDEYGLGQYCLELYNSGAMELYEKTFVVSELERRWVHRTTFSIGMLNSRDNITLLVNTDAALAPDGSFYASEIVIFVINHPTQGGNLFIEQLINLASEVLGAQHAGLHQTFSFKPEQDRGLPLLPIQRERIRIDMLRNSVGSFNVWTSKYATSARLVDGPIHLGFPPSKDTPVYVKVYGHFPDGTTTDVELHDDDNSSVIFGTVVDSSAVHMVVKFDFVADIPGSTYHLEFVRTGDGTKTPTIRRFTFSRDVVISAPESTLWHFPDRNATVPSMPVRGVLGVQIQGPDVEPNAEGAVIHLADFTGQAPHTQKKTGHPIDIDIYATDGTLRSRIFSGYVKEVETRRLGKKANHYPFPSSYDATLICSGRWSRLRKRLSPGRTTLMELNPSAIGSQDDATRPMKVKDAFIKLMVGAGIPSERIDIPDLDLRLSVKHNENSLVIQPDEPLAELAENIIRDYYGAAIVNDENAGTDGMIRVILPPSPPYNVVLRFDPTNGPGVGVLHHVEYAYLPVSGIGAYSSQTIQVLPVYRAKKRWIPPEGNCVIIIGGAGDQNSEEAIYQYAINVNSYNALNLPSSHAKYPDSTSEDALMEFVPIMFENSSLCNDANMNFICRRTYDVACYAKEIYSFTSLCPLFIDANDAFQVRERIPRIGDMCEIKQLDGSWKTYMIASCNPVFKKSHLMLAEFECVRTNRFSKIATPAIVNEERVYEKELRQHLRKVSGVGNRSLHFGTNRATENLRTRLATLPGRKAGDIQDLNPDSATFGEFYYMPGYDTP